MSIASLDDWIASVKQTLTYSKTVGRISVANTFFTVHDLAGNPGSATLAVGNTANGLVPVSGPAGSQTNGYPLILFSAGSGYLANVDFASTVSCRMFLYDRLFNAGAYAFNASTSLSAQPSFSGRVPGGTDFTGLQIWYEQVTAATGNQSVAVTYTDQSGNAAHTTGTIGLGVAPSVGRMFQLPLAPGDSGVQKIESVTGTVASVGTFNIVVARPLWSGRVHVANSGDCHGPDRVGMPQVWATSAFALIVVADSTGTGNPDLTLQIASK